MLTISYHFVKALLADLNFGATSVELTASNFVPSNHKNITRNPMLHQVPCNYYTSRNTENNSYLQIISIHFIFKSFSFCNKTNTYLQQKYF